MGKTCKKCKIRECLEKVKKQEKRENRKIEHFGKGRCKKDDHGKNISDVCGVGKGVENGKRSQAQAKKMRKLKKNLHMSYFLYNFAAKF